MSTMFAGHCRHRICAPGGKQSCAKGVDIRAHVGGPDFGWLTRIPCIDPSASKYIRADEVVPCAHRDLVTAEEAEEARAQFARDCETLLAGLCPECGAATVERENETVRVLACPNGCSGMRECKRIGP